MRAIQKCHRLSIIFFIKCIFLVIFFSKTVIADSNPISVQSLSLNDISYLWPVPKSADDVANLLNAATEIDGGAILSDEQFQQIISTAEKVAADSSSGMPKTIIFPNVTASDKKLKSRETWKVVGFRVDPSAPSTDPGVIKKFGSIPQIRLILQPITVSAKGDIEVYDFSLHLPFSYAHMDGSIFAPDKKKFSAIVFDLIELKKYLLQSSSPVSTDGPLQTHPGLTQNIKGFNDKVSSFLHKNLAQGNLNLISFMGLAPRPEPWVFFPMTLGINNQPKAQMLFVLDSKRPASPPINGKNTNVDGSIGVTTAPLFLRDAGSKLNEPAINGHASPLNSDIPDIIANPTLSNVLNTDCVSCHSETTRRFALNIVSGKKYAYSAPKIESLVLPVLLPKSIWNLRNFGWFSESPIDTSSPFISIRAANETYDALEYIKTNYSDINLK